MQLVSAWEMWAPILAREMLAIRLNAETDNLKATVDAFQSRYCLSHELMREVIIRTGAMEKEVMKASDFNSSVIGIYR